jgi:hypothetical protein
MMCLLSGGLAVEEHIALSLRKLLDHLGLNDESN